MTVEKNNDLLLKNHELRPSSSKPVPETNAIANKQKGNRKKGQECRPGSGRNEGHLGPRNNNDR